MQDYLYVSFFLGHERGDEARRLLADSNLLTDVALDQLGSMHTGVRLRLPAEDPRLEPLLERLRERGVKPLTRVDRVHTKSELDAADWLVLRIATAGLYGGVDYGQVYDFGHACRTCGAGAVPVAPLLAELGAMGQKDIDHLVYEARLIVTARVATGLTGLTGFEIQPVKTRRRPPDARFGWLKVAGYLPKLDSSTTGYSAIDVCPTCGRSGHYRDLHAPEAPVYASFPSDACDFNHTFEYFGDWRQICHPSQARLVGGGAGIVVSQRARKTLEALGVRRLVWVAVACRPTSASPDAPDVGA
ncbi:MAG: hypothetical protein KKA32_06245 [Actinobacteria bacterium]|nr:hypothetical protein [Actinomycetota bacterium]